MASLDWYEAIKIVEPHIVRVMTQEESGTGFLVYHSATDPVCAIATAAHVINRAQYWEQSIRLEHKESGNFLLLKSVERAIFSDENKDTAAILFSKGDLSLPLPTLDLAPEEKCLKIGTEIGWLGFPAITPEDLCFFSGRISCYLKTMDTYLVDGIVIPGVSGGPAFCIIEGKATLMGVVSAYIANRATGESLPGLSVVTNVVQFQELSRRFKSVEEAKRRGTSF